MTVSANIQKLIYFLKAQLLLGFFVLLNGCGQPREIFQLTGQTMGTTYSIKVIPNSSDIDKNLIKHEVDSILVLLNNQLSTWDPESEISRFNRSNSTDIIPVSPLFKDVVESAIQVANETDGAFDITVYDLMRLWGFGPNPKKGLPNIDTIKSTLAYTGYKQLTVSKNGLAKRNGNVKLDLNALAKGYAVDLVFNYLKINGFNNIFVEIGGEVKCLGKNQYNKRWSIGIENPSGGHKTDKPFAAIVYTDSNAIATSGNYRNFVDINGEKLGHTINPKTGFPIQTDILSVTILSQSCMLSDAWATGLMAIDFENGLKKVNENSSIKAVWILEREDGTRRIARSEGAKVEDSIYEIIM